MPAKTQTKTERHSPPALHGLAALSQVAFVLALALVVARCTILETVRDAFLVSPGSSAYPSGPGPTTSLVLDVLCCVPALLVLLRRLLDKTYNLRWTWSLALLIPMLGWMVLSIRWADDKFATLINSANVVAAFALMWAAVQLVRSWLRLRLVAAVAYGLLLVLLAQGFYYKFVDLPDTQKSFLEQKDKFLQQRGWAKDDFTAKQFELKILSGEMIGFSASSNSFAAMLVLMMTIGIGLAIQRVANRDPGGWAATILLAVPLTIWMLVFTHSKAALVSPLLGMLMLAMIWFFRAKLASKSKLFFWMGAGLVVLMMAAVLGHGLYHHSLPSSSLNFRWRYWVASWRMFLRHPVHGVGWDNFGLHYLRDRLAVASEEIKDPHNFIIRFFVELGLIGGVFMLAWLTRMWWELTRPVTPLQPLLAPSAQAAAGGRNHSAEALLWIAAVSVLAGVVNIAASVDFSQESSFIIVELIKRALFLCALVVGLLVASLKSIEHPQLDDRPAPWVLHGILVALGVFLIHNLIEFSLFEPGTMCLFALLCGAALGVRHPPVAGQQRQTGLTAVSLVTAIAALLAVAIFIIAPTAAAETQARRGDDAVRAGKLSQAASAYGAAFLHQPLNADYAFMAGRALHIWADAAKHNDRMSELPPGWDEQIRSFYTIAINRNPSDVGYYISRAHLAEELGDVTQLVRNFEKAMELDPNEVSTRLRYAKALQDFGRRDQARQEYLRALQFNDQLDAAEPKRIPPEQVEKIRLQIEQLK